MPDHGAPNVTATASIALSNAVLLIATVSAGLTQATPDFLFGVAMPVRF
jgi:hypothetical protein